MDLEFLKLVKKFIEEYFNYTTEISITESEWLGNFEWLDEWHKGESEDTMRYLYHKEALKDLLYDLIFEQDKIKEQLETDIDTFGVDSAEFEYIKDFYNNWKNLFMFKIKELEKEEM